MVIDFQDLKKVINIVLERCLNNIGLEIETDKDYYWFISPDNGFNLSTQPERDEICVGDLEDDYSSLLELLDKQRDANILDFERISSLLNVITYEIEQSKEKWF